MRLTTGERYGNVAIGRDESHPCVEVRSPASLLHFPSSDPFVRLNERITAAQWPSDDDGSWLRDRLMDLQARWDDRPTELPEAVIHGDAWAGNIVDVEGQGVTLMDLEHCSAVPPEWDLTSTACRLTSLSTLTATEYAEYCDAYGADVTRWAGFELFRDIRELRVTCFAAYVAQSRSELRDNACDRVKPALPQWPATLELAANRLTQVDGPSIRPGIGAAPVGRPVRESYGATKRRVNPAATSRSYAARTTAET